MVWSSPVIYAEESFFSVFEDATLFTPQKHARTTPGALYTTASRESKLSSDGQLGIFLVVEPLSRRIYGKTLLQYFHAIYRYSIYHK